MAICTYDEEDECCINYLPDELLTKIFSFFTLQELSCTVRVVCQRWHNISYSQPLWTKLGEEDIKSLSAPALLEIIRNNSIKNLSLDNCYEIPQDCLLNIANLVPNLTELSLTFCTQIDKEVLTQFSENCRNITSLCLDGCENVINDYLLLFQHHNLSRLNLSHCNNLTNESVLFVANTFRNIQNLNIDGVQWVSDEAVNMLLQNCMHTIEVLWLDGENLTDVALQKLPSCEKLRTLKISYCDQLTDTTLSFITCIAKLEELALRKGKKFCNEAIIFMFQNLQAGLSYLDFTDCQKVDDAVLENIAQSSPNLRTLDLSWCWDITDEGLKYIVCNCQKIENLTLTGLHAVTVNPLRGVIEQLPRLKYLDLTNCNTIQDDVIKHLANQKKTLKILDYYGSVVK